MPAKSTRGIGTIGEDIAASFLHEDGYIILEKNFYFNHGEIDIIAKEGDVLVFVEVKLRHSNRFGQPEESVTPKKQELIRRTAEGYVSLKNLGEIECRFDVVSITMKDGHAECTVLKNCF